MKIKQTSFCTFEIECDRGKIVINPTKKIDADIKLFSINNSPYLEYSSDTELVINSAGEFERKDIFVHSQKNHGEEIFVFNVSADGITFGVIAFSTDLTKIPEELFENTDVMLIGVGGAMNADSKSAINFIEKLSPSIAIVFGMKEQAEKNIADIVDSIEDVKKNIPLLKEVPKTLKLEESDLKDIESTIFYYIN